MGEADQAWDRSWEKEAVRGRDRIKELEAFDSSWQQVVAKRDAHIKELAEALRWLTNICCGAGKSGGQPTSEEGDDAIANAQRVVAEEAGRELRALAGKEAHPSSLMGAVARAGEEESDG